jgi:hypothetical protein
VQRVVQLLHKKKKPALFIKLDISKAFDSMLEFSIGSAREFGLQYKVEGLDHGLIWYGSIEGANQWTTYEHDQT